MVPALYNRGLQSAQGWAVSNAGGTQRHGASVHWADGRVVILTVMVFALVAPAKAGLVLYWTGFDLTRPLLAISGLIGVVLRTSALLP